MAPVGSNTASSSLPVHGRDASMRPTRRRSSTARSSRCRALSTTSCSPQESTNAGAEEPSIDQGVRLHRAGQRFGRGAWPSSDVRSSKHNERNPGKEVVYVNYAAVDPDADQRAAATTGTSGLDADTSMKMEALTTWVKDQPRHQEGLPDQPELRPSARQCRTSFAKEMHEARKRPDVQFVGDDLHPLAQDHVTSRPMWPRSRPRAPTRCITGNWGNRTSDAAGQGRGNDAGLNVKWS